MLYANKPFRLSEQLLLTANIEAIVLKAKKPLSGIYIGRHPTVRPPIGKYGYLINLPAP